MKKVAAASILIGAFIAGFPVLNNNIMLALSNHSYISGGVLIALGTLLLISDWNSGDKIVFDPFDKTPGQLDSEIIKHLTDKGYNISKKF